MAQHPPHDAFFKAVFSQVEHASALVRRMGPEELLARVDWATMRPEPGSFVNPLLGQRHTDLLFSVRIAGRLAYIYYLLEHQSTNPKRMPLRMLDYSVRIWDHHQKLHEDDTLPLIVSIVIANTPGGWVGPLSFHDLCEPHPSSIPGVAELIPFVFTPGVPG
jgi:predicted transposase/invertase (TIGR01784 family)